MAAVLSLATNEDVSQSKLTLIYSARFNLSQRLVLVGHWPRSTQEKTSMELLLRGETGGDFCLHLWILMMSGLTIALCTEFLSVFE